MCEVVSHFFTPPVCFRAYQYFEQAARYNHSEAQAHLAFGYFLGDYLPQNISKAREMFEDLSQRGSPKGQLVR